PGDSEAGRLRLRGRRPGAASAGNASAAVPGAPCAAITPRPARWGGSRDGTARMANDRTPTSTAPGTQPERNARPPVDSAPGTVGRRADGDPEADAPRGKGGEYQQPAGRPRPQLTTNQGVVIADNQNSLRQGPGGPTLLEDFILR